MARLSTSEAANYDVVKISLLRKYRLSAEAFRLKFRNATKKPGEAFTEFEYSLRANLEEWLKSEGVFGDHDKVIERFCLEQFLRSIPPFVRNWFLDREKLTSVRKAAELAEEFVTRRELSREDRFVTGRKDNEVPNYGYRKSAFEKDRQGDQSSTSRKEKDICGDGDNVKDKEKRAFEKRKEIICFDCQKPGHIASMCRKEKVAFSYVVDTDENLELLRPYLYDLKVNGRECKVLRDSAATMDVVHPSFVNQGDYTGECAWIKQVVEEQSVCLPMAKIKIQGAFGELTTEAAVSRNLPEQYPYLFSNKSAKLLADQGIVFGEGVVQALTRAQAR
ncbi:uncharacterized protein LOC121833534 [Ixodes scapularis]|uniref:uncharacterized protein LOC121833534 n=1 Tax=Ixodes scapularis TaxID=6945 RepID=UPI001C38D10C|nr:uncharacterized protein LOC121833534 [Ixodes scapularis]